LHPSARYSITVCFGNPYLFQTKLTSNKISTKPGIESIDKYKYCVFSDSAEIKRRTLRENLLATVKETPQMLLESVGL
jgi:hypothetical protein